MINSPPASITTLCATAATISTSCVANTTVVPAAREGLDHLAESFLRSHIKPPRGLVQQDDARARRGDGRGRHQQTLPRGEVARMPVTHVGQAEGREAHLEAGRVTVRCEGGCDLARHRFLEQQEVGFLRTESGGAPGLGRCAIDRDGPLGRKMKPREAPKERRLTRTVAPHHRDDLAAGDLEVDPGQCHRRAVRRGESLGHDRWPTGWTRCRSGGRGQVRSDPSSVPDRQRNGVPSCERGEPSDGRAEVPRRQHRSGGPDVGAPIDTSDREVGEASDTFEAVLGDQHGEAEVVDHAMQSGEDVFGPLRVELAGRFVEDQYPGAGRERGSDRDALALSAGQASDAPVADASEREEIQHLLDPSAHRGGRDPEVLHRVGEFVLDTVQDERGRGSCGTNATASASSLGTCSVVTRPPTSTRPSNRPPEKCGTSPLIARSKVDLPAPVGPVTRTKTPSGTSRLTSTRAGLGASG